MTAAPVPVAGRYRLGETLGVGGMGRVWQARDEVLDREVAIKEIDLPEELIAGDRGAAQQRVLREARAAARLNHPNVVQVYDIFEADGRAWIVMEYVPSRSLQEVIRAEGPLAPRRVAEIGLEVLAALSAAHRAGVRHRDVKPANVLLGSDGRVVLTDFGIAAIDGDGIVTSVDVVVGSPQYMSPERVRHGETLPASDLWSLGATLYAAVEGHSPYERATAMETLTAVAADEPDPPRRAGALQPVLEGLLRKDPEARIDAAEAERRLRAALTAEPLPRRRRPRDEPEEHPPVRATAGEPPPVAAARVQPAAERRVSAATRVESAPDRPVDAPGAAETGRRRWPVLATALAVLLLAGAAAAWFALRPGPRTSAQVAPGSTTTTAIASAPAVPPAGSPSAGASGGAGSSPSAARTSSSPAGGTRARPALPDGWHDYRDPTGFAVYVPDGWRRSREGTIVYFRDSGSGRVLGIDQSDHPHWDPVADWTGKAAYRVRRGDFPGYHEIGIKGVSYWLKAADWEFTFDGTGSRRHVNNRGFVVSRSQAYGIYWQTSDAGWTAARPDLQLVFDSFRPATS
jgi:eukaryotic-like serine/threonine-protein kinase